MSGLSSGTFGKGMGATHDTGVGGGQVVSKLAHELWTQCLAEEQSVRRVTREKEANETRAQVRRLAREAGVRIRTARMGDTVVVVRLDARIWKDDVATMRRKLTPQA